MNTKQENGKAKLQNEIKQRKIGMWSIPVLLVIVPFITSNMIVILAVVFGAAVAFITNLIHIKKLQTQVNAMEDMTEEEQSQAYTKFNKSRMFAIVAMLAVAIFCFMAGNGVFDSILKSNDKSDGEKCRICKREKDLVAGFDMCIDCYEGFDEWNKDSKKDDK